MYIKSSPLLLFALTAGRSAVDGLTPPQPSRATAAGASVRTSAVAVPGIGFEEQVGIFNKEDTGSDNNQVAKSPLAPEDMWVANLDYEGFGKEVSALGAELLREGGNDDVEHLNKMVQWRNIAAIVGVATMWMDPNPLTVLALSTWTYSSWTMIAHHTCKYTQFKRFRLC